MQTLQNGTQQLKMALAQGEDSSMILAVNTCRTCWSWEGLGWRVGGACGGRHALIFIPFLPVSRACSEMGPRDSVQEHRVLSPRESVGSRGALRAHVFRVQVGMIAICARQTPCPSPRRATARLRSSGAGCDGRGPPRAFCRAESLMALRPPGL